MVGSLIHSPLNSTQVTLKAIKFVFVFDLKWKFDKIGVVGIGFSWAVIGAEQEMMRSPKLC